MVNLVRRTLTDAERLLKEQCEEVIRTGLTSFIEVGQALMTMRDGKLYRELYATFEDYCAAEFQLSRQRGYQLMDAAKIVSTIVDSGLPAPSNEAQARALGAVPEGRRVEVWEQTLEATDGKPTAAAVKTTADNAPANPPEEDHSGSAGPSEVEEGDSSSATDAVDAVSDAQPQVDDVSNVVDGDETEVQGEAPRQPSAPVELPQEQPTTGVSVAAPAGDPERSGGSEEQGQAAASVPAPPRKSFDDLLDEHVPDQNPHANWRAAWLKAIRNAYGPASFAVVDIATNGDETTFSALIDVRDFFDTLLTDVQAERIRIAKAEEADLPDNVTPIRRTA